MTPRPRHVRSASTPFHEGVVFDLRFGNGPSRAHPMSRSECVIGASEFCDIHLSGSRIPEVICRIRTASDDLLLDRVDDDFPILHNNRPLPTNLGVPLRHGDRLNLGSAEIIVTWPGSLLHPELVPLHTPPPIREQRQSDERSSHQFEAELKERERQLDLREAALAQRLPQAIDPTHQADAVRLLRLQETLEQRQAELDRRQRETDIRYEQLTRDAIELEEQMRLVTIEQETIIAENARLELRQHSLDTQGQRQAERSAQLEAQQATLAILQSRLDRQRQENETESTRIALERGRIGGTQAELDERLREAERLRSELANASAGQAEQSSLLETTLAEIQQQKETIAAESARLEVKEAELDGRSAEFAEQAAILKSRINQVAELQERLEADRQAVRTRELNLSESDSARQTFQEQLRRRAEELSARSHALDEQERQLTEARDRFEQIRLEADTNKQQANEIFAQVQERELGLAQRESSIERKLARLREVGQSFAQKRKDHDAEVRNWSDDQTERDRTRAEQLAEFKSLQAQLPKLHEQAEQSIAKLNASRETLRGHLGELHGFAGQAREEIESARQQLRDESERLSDRERKLEAARAEHRLAVTEYRQQLLDWQAKIKEIRQEIANDESRLQARDAELSIVVETTTTTNDDLAKQAEELRREREQVAEQRGEVERHLADLRAWYRRKLRELATERIAHAHDSTDNPDVLPLHPRPTAEELDPGDKQLGELLESLELVDPDTLNTLWAEARRQHRSLRQTLLSSGTVTVYQLALIEADNLDGLILDRLRVIDRLRVTAHETMYRVSDPARSEPRTSVSGSAHTFLLRHLAEGEMDDAVRPHEFRDRFAMLVQSAHPNWVRSIELMELDDRPAVLQEWLTGLPSSDWPAEAAQPGVWLRLLNEVARGLNAAHLVGLAHGRLAPETIILTHDGHVKIVGLGEPPWLRSNSFIDAMPHADMQALARIAFAWTQLGQSNKRRSKSFPESLTAVIRRLEADTISPMSDTITHAEPYANAQALCNDLQRLISAFPCDEKLWNAMMNSINGTPDEVKRSA